MNNNKELNNLSSQQLDSFINNSVYIKELITQLQKYQKIQNNVKIEQVMTNSMQSNNHPLQDILLTANHHNICEYIPPTQQHSCGLILNQTLSLGLTNFNAVSFNILQAHLLHFLSTQQQFNSISNLLLHQSLVQVDQALYNYVTPVVIKVQTQFNNYLNALIYQLSLYFNIAFILYIMILIFTFIFWWSPFTNNINMQVNRTISMLKMIPPQVIINNFTIKKFIKQLHKKLQQF